MRKTIFFQLLFDPFEQQFDCPPVRVEGRDLVRFEGNGGGEHAVQTCASWGNMVNKVEDFSLERGELG